MQQLNLPAYNYRLKKAGGKVWIFDGIRKKFVLLTPEEWVRQHLVHYLVGHLNYPKGLIKVETGLTYNTLQKRSDIVVLDRDGKNWMVIECKSPSQKITADTALQVAVYNSGLKAQYILISNGLNHFCFAADFSEHHVHAVDAIPRYPQ
jgi:hypothetical protein